MEPINKYYVKEILERMKPSPLIQQILAMQKPMTWREKVAYRLSLVRERIRLLLHGCDCD